MFTSMFGARPLYRVDIGSLLSVTMADVYCMLSIAGVLQCIAGILLLVSPLSAHFEF